MRIGGSNAGIDPHGRRSPAATEVRQGPVCSDRQAAENEDKPAGFAAHEFLDAKPTGTWHWLVALFPRYRAPSIPMQSVMSPRVLTHPRSIEAVAPRPRDRLSVARSVARNPDLRFVNESPGYSSAKRRRPIDVSDRTVFLPAPTLGLTGAHWGSLRLTGAMQAGASLTLCGGRRGSGGESERSRYRGFLVAYKVLWS